MQSLQISKLDDTMPSWKKLKIPICNLCNLCWTKETDKKYQKAKISNKRQNTNNENINTTPLDSASKASAGLQVVVSTVHRPYGMR